MLVSMVITPIWYQKHLPPTHRDTGVWWDSDLLPDKVIDAVTEACLEADLSQLDTCRPDSPATPRAHGVFLVRHAFAIFYRPLGDALDFALRKGAVMFEEAERGCAGGYCAQSQGRADSPAYINMDDDGTLATAVYLAHEAGHFADFVLGSMGQRTEYLGASLNVREIQAFVSQMAFYDYMENAPDIPPDMARAAQQHRLYEMGGFAQNRAPETGRILTQQTRAQFEEMHRHGTASILAAGIYAWTKQAPKEASEKVLRLLYAGGSGLSLDSLLEAVGADSSQGLQSLACKGVAAATAQDLGSADTDSKLDIS
jgi:hypothetical protein